MTVCHMEIVNDRVPQGIWNDSMPQRIWKDCVPQRIWDDRVPQRIWNDRVPLKIWDDRVPQRIWNDRVPQRICDDRVPHSFFTNFRWFWSHDSIPLTKFHLSSLKSKKVWKKHALCAPCAPTVRPLCTPCATLVQFPKKSTVWPLRNLGPFEIDLGYCSTRSKDTAPQNQKILLHTQRKSWWDTAPQLQKILLHTLRRRWKILLHHLFLVDSQSDEKFSAGW